MMDPAPSEVVEHCSHPLRCRSSSCCVQGSRELEQSLALAVPRAENRQLVRETCLRHAL